MAVSEDQQFCLRWNNFQAYITSQFETLRDDEDFVDVTLACEGQRLGAHKVVLSACSPFFKELFKTNPCPHPIIFMRDVELQHVIALLEFMYAGEVNVAQQHLPGFLKTAESLQIRGLTDASKEHTENEQYTSQTPTPVQTNQCSTTSNRGLTLKSKLYPTEPKYSPSRMVTSTQDKSREPNLTSSSPTPKKRSKTDSDENDRLTDPSELDLKHHKADDPKTNSSINPFAIVPSKSLHSEIDISSEFIEPKLELPDYSEEDTSHDESQNFMDLNETPNSFAAMTGGGDNPGTSVSAETSQESQD